MPSHRPRDRWSSVRLLAATGVLTALGLLGWSLCAPSPVARPTARFIGRSSCAECHPQESEAFEGSHHDLAMQEATGETVLGDFRGVTFEHFGETTIFRRDGDHFIVRTAGPDGKQRDYEIAYTFGVTPLQQYLVDIGRGRLQALTVAWDSRPAAVGGQRWYSLYPGEPTPPGDELHWTGIQQNWNYMCADCHSTDLRRGYDENSDTYDTTFAEIDVSCESCHGPASHHVAWARGETAFADCGTTPGKGLEVAFDEREGVAWSTDEATGLPRRSRTRTSQKEIDTCGRCHSRRTTFADGVPPGRPLLDSHDPALLTEGLFHPDGQIEGEVYVYQSFLQSRMGHRGVTCSDCHDPHSAGLRLPGNKVCLQCHAPNRYDAPAHHHHTDDAGSRCIACHAPTTTFMGIDERHDHGFRIPRPDLAAGLGVPDACTGCHRDREPKWAADRLRDWYGRLRTDRSTFAEAFAAARRADPLAESRLLEVTRDEAQPAIVRATALFELPRPPGREALAAFERAVSDADPIVRRTAARVLADASERDRGILRPLLSDPVRGVRAMAARALCTVDTTSWPPDETAALRRALAEYVAGERHNAGRPEAHMNLGALARDLGRHGEAEREYRRAIDLHPAYAPAYVNLADVQRELGRDVDCEATLRRGLAAAPSDPSLRHAIGLCLVRLHRLREALPELERAAMEAPGAARYRYVLAVAQEAAGDLDAAISTLRRATARLPDDRDVAELLVEYLRKQGALDEARQRAAAFAARWPDAPAVRRWRGSFLR